MFYEKTYSWGEVKTFLRDIKLKRNTVLQKVVKLVDQTK